MTTETPKISTKFGKGNPGKPKGAVSKTPALIKDMIAQALTEAGGVEYLTARANDPRTASAFLGLVGKVLPMTLTGPDGGAIKTVTRIELVAMKPND